MRNFAENHVRQNLFMFDLIHTHLYAQQNPHKSNTAVQLNFRLIQV